MGRILFRLAAALTFIHAALTFMVAAAIFHSISADLLAFAQHGFAFAFLAGLNLSVLQAPGSSRAARYFVHASNLTFLAYYVVFAFVKPEAPQYAAVGILVLLTVTGLFQGSVIRRAASSRNSDGQNLHEAMVAVTPNKPLQRSRNHERKKRDTADARQRAF